ncbi:MAG: hypothetical protein AAFX50_07680 [Acidobacteriota bacterium]
MDTHVNLPFHQPSRRRPRADAARLLVAGLSLLAAGPAAAQDLGDQEIAPQPAIAVNTVTDGAQGQLDMALAPNDDMVFVWERDAETIAARRVAADGSFSPMEELVVNANTELAKDRPAVCVDAAGNAVVVWEELDASGSTARNILYRRFDSSLAPLGPEAIASAFPTGSQIRPDVACAANGDFTIVWGGESAGDADGVTGRRFEADGTPIGGDFQVSTTSGRFSDYAGTQVAARDDGDFVVLWSETGGGTDDFLARRFSADGVALDAMPIEIGDEFVYRMALDRDRSSGNFIVSWNDNSNFGQDIQARLFDEAAVPMGDVRFADVDFTAVHNNSAAFSGPNGEVVVAWNPQNAGVASAQRLDAAMQPIGSEFVLGEGDGGFISFDRFVIEGSTSGELALGYADFVTGQSRDIFARRFLQAIFADGFESGDTSEWSNVVQE